MPKPLGPVIEVRRKGVTRVRECAQQITSPTVMASVNDTAKATPAARTPPSGEMIAMAVMLESSRFELMPQMKPARSGPGRVLPIL